MKKTFLLLVMAFHWSAIAETNSPPGVAELFSVAPCQLRPLETERDTPPSPDAHQNKQVGYLFRDWEVSPPEPGTNSSHASFEARSLSKFDMGIYERLERAGYLTAPELPTDNRLLHFVHESFEPEVIHWRKVSISSPLITAINRKNPLCLINLIFLDVRW